MSPGNPCGAFHLPCLECSGGLTQLSIKIPPTRFELVSPAPKAGMIDRYTTGVIINWVEFTLQIFIKKICSIDFSAGDIKSHQQRLKNIGGIPWSIRQCIEYAQTVLRVVTLHGRISLGSNHDVSGFFRAGFLYRFLVFRYFILCVLHGVKRQFFKFLDLFWEPGQNFLTYLELFLHDTG